MIAAQSRLSCEKIDFGQLEPFFRLGVYLSAGSKASRDGVLRARTIAMYNHPRYRVIGWVKTARVEELDWS